MLIIVIAEPNSISSSKNPHSMAFFRSIVRSFVGLSSCALFFRAIILPLQRHCARNDHILFASIHVDSIYFIWSHYIGSQFRFCL